MSIEQETSSEQSRTPMGRAVKKTAAKPEGLVSHYPLPAALIVFGVGLGVGVALASIMCGPVTPPPSYLHRAELAAGHVGRQMRGAIAGVLPEALAKHISA